MTDKALLKESAQAYAAFFNRVSLETLDEVHALISDDVHFVDPFHDIKGRDKFEKVFAKLYKDTENPKFTVTDLAWSGELCFIRWDFSCYQRMLGDWSFRGMSELHFDADGKVCAHYDYWDASQHFYAKLPVVGWLIRWIARKAGQ